MSTATGRQAAIVAIGCTPQGRLPDRTVDDLVIWAIEDAMRDGKVRRDQVDGLFVQRAYSGGGDHLEVGRRIGLMPRVSGAVDAGGASGAATLQHAAALVAAGMASCVVCAYGTNQRSKGNRFERSLAYDGPVYGLFNPGSLMALMFQRRRHLYGDTDRALATIAVNQRANARLNPRAALRDPLTFEDYYAAPLIIEPLRRHDFCYPTDGAMCVIVADSARAREAAQRPAWIAGVGRQDCPVGFEHPDSLLQRHQRLAARRVLADAGVKPADIDLLYVQDAYTPTVLSALENYGFCSEGEAASFVQSGATALGGELPVNVNGGQTSETYMVGWGATLDAVRQLRGGQGARQVPDLRFVQCCYTGGLRDYALSLIYASEPRT